MKSQIRLLAMICILAAPTGAGQGHDPAQSNLPCGVIGQALSDYRNLKVGIQRQEVEKYFVRDGGLQFPGATSYTYPKCNLLHVDVDFTAKGGVEHPFSPDDVVTKVSKMYVEYSVKD